MSVLMCVTAAAAVVALGALPAQVEHLGQPCRAKNVLAGRAVVDRADGRERLVLTNMNEDTGCELIFIDYDKDTGRVYRAPAGAGSWALNEVPGDRLVVGTFYDGRFMVFDLRKMEFVKSVDFPGESYIWNLALGSDGRIYGGTYRGAKLGAFDLNSYTVEDCGAPAPPNLYLRYVSSTPDGRILCHFYTEKPASLLYDPRTKSFGPAPKNLENVSQGVSWNGYFLHGSQVCDGKSLEAADPPFPTPPADKGQWQVDTYVTTDDTLVLRQGSAVYSYKPGDKALTLISDFNLRGRIVAISRKGELLGVRGQDYFVVKPGDKELHLKPIPVESGPRPTLFLRADDKGRLWGGPHFGQTLFWMDPVTKKTVNTGAICDAGGEVYDVAFCGGKVYAASYAGGDIIQYDPEQPWDQWNAKNPRPFADVGERGYIRPTAGIMLGPDGKLYSGWMAKYGTYGGAVAITDPATGKTELIENPLGEQATAGLAVDDRFAYVGTSLGANGLPNKQGEWAKLGIIELATGKVVFEQTIDGAHSVGRFGYDTATRRLALVVGSELRIFDTVKRKFVEIANPPPVGSRGISAPGNGTVYYGSGNSVVALNMLSGEAVELAELPRAVETLTTGPDGAIYASCGVDIYAIRAGK